MQEKTKGNVIGASSYLYGNIKWQSGTYIVQFLKEASKQKKRIRPLVDSEERTHGREKTQNSA